MAQNEQTTEERSTLEQQSPGRLDHPAWSVVWIFRITLPFHYISSHDLQIRLILLTSHHHFLSANHQSLSIIPSTDPQQILPSSRHVDRLLVPSRLLTAFASRDSTRFSRANYLPHC